MSRYAYVEPTEELMFELVSNLRKSDYDELNALHDDPDYLAIIRDCVERSEETYMGVDSEGVVLCYGVGSHPQYPQIGIPWMLGTARVNNHPRQVLIDGRERVRDWRVRYSFMYNFVYEKNLKTKSWLRRIGFRLEEPEPFGVKGEPFRKFTAEGLFLDGTLNL